MSTENQLAIIPMAELQTMAEAVNQSGMFGLKSPAQALTLFLLCQAEGIHPLLALRRYHIVEGRPSMRADAMAGEFAARGGLILWHLRTDDVCAATFFQDARTVDKESAERGRARCRAIISKDVEALISLSYPGEETIVRTMKDADEKGLSWSYKEEKGKWEKKTKTNWEKSPRQMLTARAITEGVRLINPGLVAGIYEEDEVRDIVTEEAFKVNDPNSRDKASIQAMIDQHLESAKNAATDGERKRYHGLVADLRLKLAEMDEQPAQIEDKPEIATVAKVIDATDATVEPPPKKTRAKKEKPTQESEPEPDNLDMTPTGLDWRTVESHIGKAEGPILNRPVGELQPKLLEWLKTQMEKNGARPDSKGTKNDILLWAVIEALNDRAETLQKAKETLGTPKPATLTPEEGSKHAGGHPEQPTPLPDEYGKAQVPFDCSTKGKPLEELSETQFKNLRPWVHGNDYIDWESPDGRTDDELFFRRAYNALADKLGYFAKGKK